MKRKIFKCILYSGIIVCLVIAVVLRTDVKKPEILVAPKFVNLGLLSPGVESVEVIIPVSNGEKSRSLNIDKVSGACTCLHGAVYPHSIDPGSTGELKLTFNVARFVDAGQWDTSVAVSFNAGLENLVSKIPIKAKFARSEQALFVPPKASITISADSSQKYFTKEVHVYVPRSIEKDVSVEVGELPNSVSYSFGHASSKTIGEFKELTSIMFTIDVSSSHAIAQHFSIPIIVTGSTYKKYTFGVDVYITH